jgi:hypothetical protein
VPDRRGRRIGFRRTTNDWYDATYANPTTVDPTVYEDEHQVVVVPNQDLDFTSMMWLRPKLP